MYLIIIKEYEVYDNGSYDSKEYDNGDYAKDKDIYNCYIAEDGNDDIKIIYKKEKNKHER